MKLLPLQDVTEADLPYICSPLLASHYLNDAYAGYVRIQDFDDIKESCEREACELEGDPWHWNRLLLGKERMMHYVDRGSLVVLDASPPDPPWRAYDNQNGQWVLTTNVRDLDAREHLQYHSDRLHHERQERERYVANHPPARESEHLPATGSGYSKPTLGPHAGGEPVSIRVANSANSAATALDELKQLPSFSGKSKSEIEGLLKSQGYKSVPAKNGGAVWTKNLADGNTAAVRLDPPTVRDVPKGFADEVSHAHKEIVPTKNVTDGNYAPGQDVTTLDDACRATKEPHKAHIPIK